MSLVCLQWSSLVTVEKVSSANLVFMLKPKLNTKPYSLCRDEYENPQSLPQSSLANFLKLIYISLRFIFWMTKSPWDFGNEWEDLSDNSLVLSLSRCQFQYKSLRWCQYQRNSYGKLKPEMAVKKSSPVKSSIKLHSARFRRKWRDFPSLYL